LRTGEKVLWSGKPVKMPFVLPHSLIMIPFGLFFMAFSISFMIPAFEAPFPWSFFPWLFFLAGFGACFGEPIYLLMAYRNTEYMITDQRVIIQTGAIGLDTRFVEFDKIQETYVDVSFIDKAFGTGTVLVTTAGEYGYVYSRGRAYGLRPSLASLREPYEVQKLLQEAVEKARVTRTR